MLNKTFESKIVEAKFSKIWEEQKAYKPKEGNGETFSIVMPPPNVTGSLHIGHALNHCLQDMICRFQRMLGKEVLWQPGTDHAGIATQMVVERKLAAENKDRRNMGRDAFLDEVWAWKEESGSAIVNQLKALGVTPDWDRERFTMDEGLNKAVCKTFVQLYNEGLIYQDKRLVNWDVKFQTAISDLEVEQKEVKSHLWHFKYPLKDQPGQFIIVATTRPETMLGDTAVAVHPDDERYKDLVGKTIILPLVGREIPIVADEYADPETGSGAVKITPAHDFNDFEVGKRHDLEMINILDESGILNNHVPERFHLMNRFDARKKIVAELEELGLVDKIEDHIHMVPYGDRSGAIIEPYLTDQWYCDAKTLAQPAIKAVESGEIDFIPKQWENSFFDWMRKIEPWCISRQLWWGHQIPVWYGDDGEIFVAETEEEAHEMAEKHYGKPEILRREDDVLDTWFSSALWPFSALGWPDNMDDVNKFYPTSVLVTGFDIIFFWVARMMMMGLHFMKEIPFKQVYIHALVRDEKGQKMSKTKGNVIDPLVIIDKFGADALRMTLAAMAAQGRDIKLSEARIEGYRNFTTKLWNVANYLSMNECVVNPAFEPAKAAHPVNQWIISKCFEAAIEVKANFEKFRFNDVALGLYHFTWNHFCDWYIEITKPMLQSDDAALIQETKETMSWVFQQIITMLNPIMPFVTEELNEVIGANAGLLIHATWPSEKMTPIENPKAVSTIEALIELVTSIRSMRAELSIAPSALMQLYAMKIDEVSKQLLTTHADILKRLARLDGLHLENAPGKAVELVVGKNMYRMPVGDVIDFDKEKDRLTKQMLKIAKEKQGISGRLSNENFVAKAPAHVIEEAKSRLDELSGQITNIEQSLVKLAELI